MTPTEQRISDLAKENLNLQDIPFDSRLSDAGASSVSIVAFGKVVAKEFGISMVPEDCANLSSLRDFAKFIEARSG